MNRQERRQAGMRKSRRVVGASILAFGGLASGYLHALRQPPSAYAIGGMCSPSVYNTSDLNSAIADFNNGGCSIIEIDPSASSPITLSGNVTPIVFSGSSLDELIIKGNGKTLDGAGQRRPFTVTMPSADDSLTISDITLTKTSSETSTGSFAHDGGAIAVNGNRVNLAGHVTLDDVTIIGSTARNGSGYEGFYGGGALLRVGTATIVGGAFQDDTATIGGGLAIFASDDTITISGTNFIGNQVRDDTGVSEVGGGAVAIGFDAGTANRVTITDATFTGNGIDITTPDASALGGAIGISNALGDSGNAYIQDSIFTSNYANSNHNNQSTSSSAAGGAVSFAGSPGRSLSLSDVTLTSNTAYSLEGSAYGGAIFAGGTIDPITVERSTFSANQALASGQGYGGAIHANRGAAIVDSAIVDGTAAFGGGIFTGSGSLQLDNSYVGGNSSGFAGAAIAGLSVDIRFSTIYDNQPFFPYFGVVYAADLNVIGSVIANPSAGVVPLAYVSGTLDDTYSVSSQPGAFSGPGSVNVDPGTVQLEPRDGTAPGELGRPPAATSPLVTGAPTSNLGTGIGFDQLGVPRTGTWTIGSRQVAGTPPNPPTPAPVFPPSAPRDPSAEPGDGSATVSWRAPESSGSFPVTNYRVVAQPGGASCLVAAPATSCVVTGLTNGQPYTFTVDALNGAGWGASSRPTAPVTPQKAELRLTLDQGTRVPDGRHDRIGTGGSSVGIPEGARLTPYIRYSGQNTFQQGKATITVQSDGTFTWTRQIRADRGLSAYVMWEDIKSNQVFWAKVR